MSPTAPEAIVFDLDGTLIDSAPSLQRACAQMLAERGLPAPDLVTIKGFIGEGVPKLVQRCLTWAGAANDPAALERFNAIYNVDPLIGTSPLPHAQKTLRSLAATGHPMGLCTNKPTHPTHQLLDHLNLGPFKVVVAGDTLAVRKPDPAPLTHTIKALDATPETAIYVGDSKTDWRTAAAAGVRYIHIAGGYETQRPPSHTWRIISNLEDLMDAIAR